MVKLSNRELARLDELRPSDTPVTGSNPVGPAQAHTGPSVET
jgi:hypothetical protein